MGQGLLIRERMVELRALCMHVEQRTCEGGEGRGRREGWELTDGKQGMGSKDQKGGQMKEAKNILTKLTDNICTRTKKGKEGEAKHHIFQITH